MEFNVKKIIDTKYFVQKPDGNQKHDITHIKIYNNRLNQIIMSWTI